MDFSDFRSRAIAEGKRYGKDEYVFVREFAQNARDAGARQISLSAVYQDGSLKIVFTDDGEGMAFSHARRYLFTLYASSKEKEAASAGQFGVGFWSILLFSPQSILIHSRTQKENWGVEFNQTLDRERPVASPLQHHGTQVVAFKSLDQKKAAECIAELEASLKRYCRYLRRNDRAASPLAVFFNEKRIDGPMVLEGECAATFSYRDVQGAVALGRSPQVSLHVRGLPVWSGTSLSELQYGASPEVPVSYPSGLAPVYLLNGNRLSVTLDRRSVFDDAALQKTRRIASREMRKLVARYLDHIAPAGLLARLEYFFSTVIEDFAYHFNRRLLPALPVLAVLLAIGAGAFHFFPELFQNMIDSSSEDHGVGMPFMATYRGGAAFSSDYERATTDTLSGDAFSMQYEPADKSLYFRTQVVEQLDIHNGAHSGRLTPYRIPAEYMCREDCLSISLPLDGGRGIYHLPIPTGYYIDRNSVSFSPPAAGELVRSSKDDWLFIYKNDGGNDTLPVIHYRAGPVTTSLPSPERYTTTPEGVPLPSAFTGALVQARQFKSLEKKVTFLTALVEQTISYDTSADTVNRYRNFFSSTPPGNWFEFVFALNRGDCDVKNIILVHLLRKVKIPARLAVGYVGRNGAAEQGKHAWAEYYHDGWKVADATGQAPEPTDNPSAAATESPNPNDAASGHQDTTDGTASRFPVSNDSGNNASPSPVSVVESGKLSPYLMWAFILAGALILAVTVILIFRMRRSSRMKPTLEQETLAARLLQAALENDKMNIRGSGLFSRALIPTWGGSRISMARANRLAKRHALYYSSEQNDLVSALIKHRRVVVNTGNAVFVAVVGRLPGSLNLEEVTSLQPVLVTADNQDKTSGHQVCHAIGALCKSLGLPPHTIVPCRGLSGMLFREFDLNALPVSWKPNMPKRFIAIKLDDDAMWQALISLGGGTQGAAILVLDRIAVHADLLFDLRDQLRTTLAELAIQTEKEVSQ
ncbi:MAG: ATP-binding protein [Deltaproteobacteria bacterium]|nr:ATP-binding protein [Deltaproteobacteria bacterium]